MIYSGELGHNSIQLIEYFEVSGKATRTDLLIIFLNFEFQFYK